MKKRLMELIKMVVREESTIDPSGLKFSQTNDRPRRDDITVVDDGNKFNVITVPNKLVDSFYTDKEAFKLAKELRAKDERASIFFIGRSGNTWIAD